MESRKRIDELLVLERRVAFEVPAAFAAEFHNRWKATLEMEAQREAEIDRVAQNPRYIPQQVKLEVFHRDKGRCVKCGSNQQIEFDHIIPVSLGGSSTANNVQLLCQSCNRTKGNREVGELWQPGQHIKQMNGCEQKHNLGTLITGAKLTMASLI